MAPHVGKNGRSLSALAKLHIELRLTFAKTAPEQCMKKGLVCVCVCECMSTILADCYHVSRWNSFCRCCSHEGHKHREATAVQHITTTVCSICKSKLYGALFQKCVNKFAFVFPPRVLPVRSLLTRRADCFMLACNNNFKAVQFLPTQSLLDCSRRFFLFSLYPFCAAHITHLLLSGCFVSVEVLSLSPSL